MIYREHADGTRYAYILTDPVYPRTSPQVYRQELNKEDMFVGKAEPLKGNRLGVAKDWSYATGTIPPGLDFVEKFMTTSRTVVTIHDDIITMRKARG